MTQEQKELLLKDLCARLPYSVRAYYNDYDSDYEIESIKIISYSEYKTGSVHLDMIDCTKIVDIDEIKPYLFPFSSMTDEDHAMYFKIWEDAGKKAYLEGCHPLIVTIRAYKAANDYLLSKHYDVNGLIPMGLANDATGLNIY